MSFNSWHFTLKIKEKNVYEYIFLSIITDTMKCQRNIKLEAIEKSFCLLNRILKRKQQFHHLMKQNLGSDIFDIKHFLKSSFRILLKLKSESN